MPKSSGLDKGEAGPLVVRGWWATTSALRAREAAEMYNDFCDFRPDEGPPTARLVRGNFADDEHGWRWFDRR